MRLAWLIAFAPLLIPCAGLAAESAPATSTHATVTLVSETDSYRPGQEFRLGLRFRLAPGWHIYWRNPGDAGAPPEIAWTLPEGARAGEIQWPAPERAAEGPITSYAYTGEIVLPVAITPPPGDAPLAIQAQANWLVCERICVPEEGSFALTLQAGTAAPAAAAPLFAAADARRPRPSPFAATLAPDGALTISGAGLSAGTVAEAWFFPGAWGAIDQNAPQKLETGDGAVTLRLHPGAQFAANQAVDGVLMLRDPRGNASFLTITAAPQAAGPGVIHVLLLALAGGLLLNLMPCVFPVLAIKAMAIARLSAQDRFTIRLGALAYMLGTLTAFLALGGALLGLRATGAALGWGFQYQSPVFVALMAWLLFGLGLNLSGVFEFRAGFVGAGQGACARAGMRGSFFTGLLAAVVATPCTAPFMGGALAAAATAPPAMALGIFAAMGLGLALPYALLGLAPALARLLPRPGGWMEVLRQALAFPMYGAAIWLLWVAGQQTGPDGVLAVASGIGLLGFAAWAFGLAQRSAGKGRHAGRIAAALATLAALALLPALPGASPGQAQAADGAEPFSGARLAALRAEGRPVFVDMTAAWCVTCLVNERVALGRRAVREEFAARNVALLRGDWTRQDKEITDFLRDAGRDGVPLYIYYPPHGVPVVLPQILTPDIVLAYLQQPPSRGSM